MPDATVDFSARAANVFLHVLTRCNLRCRYCYINPAAHGRRRLPAERIERWLAVLAERSPGANLVLLGGEPTLHPDLPRAVRTAHRLGYASVTIDTNGYLFHDILEALEPGEVDAFSFSLDGAAPETNDRLRGKGSWATCLEGIRKARARGFAASLIFTVSTANAGELDALGPLLEELGVERLFLQVLGLRGRAAAAAPRGGGGLRLSPEQWRARVPAAAAAIAARGIRVVAPRVFLDPGEPFVCAGRTADNHFVFPNGRVYRCPLGADYPIHSLLFRQDRLEERPSLNERDLFALEIPEGCVMNRLVQPDTLRYTPEGTPAYRIGCCLIKKEIAPPAERGEGGPPWSR